MVLAAFRPRAAREHFSAQVRDNGTGHARLAPAVGKNVVVQAVKRNYLKRKIREMFRHYRSRLPVVDIVVKVNKRPRDTESIKLELTQIFEDLIQCRDL